MDNYLGFREKIKNQYIEMTTSESDQLASLAKSISKNECCF